MEPDRREIPAKRLERQRVVARRELELLQADPLGQGLAHEPSTLTARAVTRTIDHQRDERLDAHAEPSRAAISGMVSVGLNALAARQGDVEVVPDAGRQPCACELRVLVLRELEIGRPSRSCSRRATGPPSSSSQYQTSRTR